jgi:cell division protein FtsZ
MPETFKTRIIVNVVGVGGAGGNAVSRMAKSGLAGVDFIALNTDIQALRRNKNVRGYAIGPNTTHGMGSGGQPEVGRKAIKESSDQIAQLLEGSDMVFITAGMGGGTGTGAAALTAEIAKKQGALTVGVVTLPFSFEGPRRRAVAEQGLHNLRQKVDTLITVENDRLLPSLNGKVSLEKAFQTADEVLRQGVQGIADIITMPGIINVDFADVKSLMTNGGPAFMAMGEGKGKRAAMEAAQTALANPLFNAPLDGAKGILFNVKGGADLTLGQVHEVASVVKKAAQSDANIVFGVVQDRRMKKRVSITLVATGINDTKETGEQMFGDNAPLSLSDDEIMELIGNGSQNGHADNAFSAIRRLF